MKQGINAHAAVAGSARLAATPVAQNYSYSSVTLPSKKSTHEFHASQL